MDIRATRAILLAGAAMLLATSGQATAGGFAVREQSAFGLGNAFAGMAAGGGASAQFWNPATMTQFRGIAVEEDKTLILPYTNHVVNPISTLAIFDGAVMTTPAFLLAGSVSTQISEMVWFGFTLNSPFGLKVEFPDLWAGRNYAQTSMLRTFNGSPAFAIKFNEYFSVALGAQVQFAQANLNTGFLAAPGSHILLEASGWGFGATAGVTFTPGPNTTIGLGWRSGIDQKLGNANLLVNPLVAASTPGPVTATVNLPNMVNFGISHRFDAVWTLKAGVEWANWSRIGTVNVLQANGAGPATIGGVPVTLPFQYRDGWFFSAGADYQVSRQLTFRGGVAYEITPIDDRVRTPRLPDNDRIWATAGLSYSPLPGMSLDVSYAHIWVKNAPINISATSGNPWFAGGVTYIGEARSHVDIISFGARLHMPPTPVLVTKG
jgi:long-chain fatty acid transport protein